MSCVYCLHHNELRDEQILLRSDNLYLCAPRGQLIEGFLVIAPYRCIGSFSQVPVSFFSDLMNLRNVVLDFYRKAYGSSHATFYEQGRSGGGALIDSEDGFPLHAHMCCLPLIVDLHAVLSLGYNPITVSGPHDLPNVARDEPYVYVDSSDDKVVYVARSIEGRGELERMRLKPTVATLMGVPQRGYWRAYPGDSELEKLIERWRKMWGK